MTKYNYQAIDSDGKTKSGEIVGDDIDTVVRKLSSRGLLATKVTAVGSGMLDFLNKPVSFGGVLTSKELVNLTRELSALLDAGLALSKALSTLQLMARNKKIKSIVSQILLHLKEGSNFADALKQQDKTFPKFYIIMVNVGETSGQLGPTLLKLSDYLVRSSEVREKIKSALIYPIILVVMVVLAMALILTVVLPQFEPIFEQSSAKLPFVTSVVMDLSRVVNEQGTLLFYVGVLMVCGSFLVFRSFQVRTLLSKYLLRVPIVGDLILKNEFSRFHRMLGTLVLNGLPLVSAISISSDGLNNRYVKCRIDVMQRRLKEGSNMSSEYQINAFIPLIATELTRVGEATGHLGEMLLRSANIMEEEVKTLVDRFMSLLVPVLTIVMGVIIAGMIASVLLGIMSVNEIAF